MKERENKIACIILAAGKSLRFGGVKQLFKIKGKTLLQRSLDTANNSSVDYVLLVMGANSSNILPKIEIGRAQFVLNRNYAKGQSTSIKCGIANLPNDCVGAVIMVADQPYLRAYHLNKIVQEFKKGKYLDAVILSHHGEPRNPVLMPRKFFPRLMRLRGDNGAKSMIRKCQGVRLVEIPDEKVFLDVDTRHSAFALNKFYAR